VFAGDLVIVIEQEKKRNAVNKKDLFQPAAQENEMTYFRP
jgi:hypothetical protein